MVAFIEVAPYCMFSGHWAESRILLVIRFASAAAFVHWTQRREAEIVTRKLFAPEAFLLFADDRPSYFCSTCLVFIYLSIHLDIYVATILEEGNGNGAYRYDDGSWRTSACGGPIVLRSRVEPLSRKTLLTPAAIINMHDKHSARTLFSC